MAIRRKWTIRRDEPLKNLAHTDLDVHSVIEEALKRYAAHSSSPKDNPLHADLRTPIYRAALRSDPAGTTAFLKDQWYTTDAVDGKEIALTVLGNCTDESIIASTLIPFLFNLSPPAHAKDSVPAADVHYLASTLASNRVARPLLWKFIRENWAQVEKKLGGNPIILDRFVGVSLSKFTTFKEVEEIDEFFNDKDRTAFARTLETAKDKVRGRAAYRARDAAVLKEWLVANGYSS